MIDKRSTRAYKLEKENRELKREIDLLKVNCNIGYEELKVAWKYKSRCKKAIERIENVRIYGLRSGKTLIATLLNDVLEILQGADKE